MATTTTATAAIPLSTLNPNPPSNNTTTTSSVTAPIQTSAQSGNSISGNGSATSSQTATAVASAPSSTNPSTAPQSSTSSRRKLWFIESLTFANGLGTTALLLAMIFGIGAWVGMNIQIGQGNQNMDLTIWTVCADHEAIQNTSLCRTILAKDFSQFGKRLESGDEEICQDNEDALQIDETIVKRAIGEDELSEAVVVMAPMDKALSKLSDYDRALVNPRPDYNDLRHQSEPSIRVMVFPLVNLLVKPLSWTFDVVESMLLTTVYAIHKVFRWLTSAVLFILQVWLYGIAESVFKSVLSVIDQAIYSLMPNFIPAILVSDIASVLALTALRAYWYGTSFLGSLKWTVIFRLAMWAFILVISSIGPFINFVKKHSPRDVAGAIKARAPQRPMIEGFSSGSDFPTSSTGSSGAANRFAMSVRPIEDSLQDSRPHFVVKSIAPPPPSRRGRSPSQQPSDRRQPHELDWYTPTSAGQQDNETEEESFYRSLNSVNKRRGAGLRI